MALKEQACACLQIKLCWHLISAINKRLTISNSFKHVPVCIQSERELSSVFIMINIELFSYISSNTENVKEENENDEFPKIDLPHPDPHQRSKQIMFIFLTIVFRSRTIKVHQFIILDLCYLKSTVYTRA